MNKLKNLILLALIGILFSTNSNAQSFTKGQQAINLGVGIGGGLGLPVGLSYEKAVTDRIGVGGYLAFSTKKDSFGGFGGWRYTHILAAAKGSYHFKVKSEKFDPYAGVLLGYNIASVKWTGDGEQPWSASAGGLMLGVHAGARYWFSDRIGVFGELGYGAGILNVGVAFKL